MEILLKQMSDFKSIYQSNGFADNSKETFLCLSLFVVSRFFSFDSSLIK